MNGVLSTAIALSLVASTVLAVPKSRFAKEIDVHKLDKVRLATYTSIKLLFCNEHSSLRSF